MASFLANQNVRREIVQRINKMVDIPYLNESHETHLISMAVDMCFNALVGQQMPSNSKAQGSETRTQDGEPDVEVEIPKGSEESVKKQLINEINAKFDLPMLNEDQEQKLIKYFVDALYDLSKDKAWLKKEWENKRACVQCLRDRDTSFVYDRPSLPLKTTTVKFNEKNVKTTSSSCPAGS